MQDRERRAIAPSLESPGRVTLRGRNPGPRDDSSTDTRAHHWREPAWRDPRVLEFPTSGTGEAQRHFETGVLYLHSFEYPSALAEFREAERIAPDFAMAYWGEAMTYTHAVWNQQDATAARAALQRLGRDSAARLARAPTPREQGYLRAVEVLYGSGTKPGRDTAYAGSMEQLAAQFPNDDEAQLFYALALLGLSQSEREVPTYMRAGAIAMRVFQRRPDHPGAAHYVIHAFDDPIHAPLGLDAARAYGNIAPDAAHALHMTSHIFLAMGMWDDVVAVNEKAVHVSRHAREQAHQPVRSCGHYPEWLEYGYLQQGRVKDAAALLDACRSTPLPEGSVDDIEGLAGMRASFVVDSRNWTSEMPASGEQAGTQAYLAFASGYAAAMRRDRPAASAALASLDAAVGKVRRESSSYARILALQLRGLVQTLGGDAAGGVARVREAARLDDALPVPFGPPLTVKPPHELAGEMLSAMQKWTEARDEFRLALLRTPRRALALLGLARAEHALGHATESRAAYRELAEIWRQADADLPELEAVRAAAGATSPAR